MMHLKQFAVPEFLKNHAKLRISAGWHGFR
jgi:hypothetical protein